MSFNRIKYDPDAIKVLDKEKTKMGHYMLFNDYPRHENRCKSSRVPRNSRSEVRQGKMGVRADIESKLHNRHVPLNRNNYLHEEWLQHEKDLDKDESCTKFDKTPDEYTRLSHPVSNYRGMETTKNVIVPYLHVNKQISVATRLPPLRGVGTSSRDLARNAAIKKREGKKN